MDSCIHSAWSWLSRSGIQNESGGVARFYSADVQEYRDISTQSTAFLHPMGCGLAAPEQEYSRISNLIQASRPSSGLQRLYS